MTPAEFHELGFLQELNRQFLHPLGLAMSVVVEDGVAVGFGDVYESGDVDGWIYSPEVMDLEFVAKAEYVQARADDYATQRRAHLGFITQPLPGQTVDLIET